MPWFRCLWSSSYVEKERQKERKKERRYRVHLHSLELQRNDKRRNNLYSLMAMHYGLLTFYPLSHFLMFLVFLLIPPSCQCSDRQVLCFIDLSHCFGCPTDASGPRMSYIPIGGNLSLLHFSWRRAGYALPLGQMAIFYTLYTARPSITTFSVAFACAGCTVSSMYM